MSTTPEPRPSEPLPQPDESSNSVKVTYLDCRVATQEITRAVIELARNHQEIQQVFLFGSLATGRAAPGSDADLLFILANSDRTFPDRIPLYMPDGCRMGVDVFPYTRMELERMLSEGNGFVRRALAEGIEIYSAVAGAPR